MSAFFSYYLDHMNSYLIGVGLMHSALIMSALSNVTLIGSVIGEVIGFAIYSLKSAKENSEGGIVYDSIFRNKEDANGNIEG